MPTYETAREAYLLAAIVLQIGWEAKTQSVLCQAGACAALLRFTVI